MFTLSWLSRNVMSSDKYPCVQAEAKRYPVTYDDDRLPFTSRFYFFY